MASRVSRSGSRAACAALAVLAAQGSARAQPSDSGVAETFFQEGKRLLDQKDFARACPKLAESQRLEPATGTLLALAMCHEGEGKTATAWAEYGEAAARAKKEGRKDREQAALQWAAELEPKLSTLTIAVPDAVAKSAALLVKRDGMAVPSTWWGTAVPVDPGEHVVALSALGKKPWSKTVVIGASTDRQTVVAEALEDLAAEPSVRTDVTPTRFSTMQRAGIVAAGAGVLALGVGTYFGIRAIHENNVSDDGCDGNACSPDAKQTRLDARSHGDTSTVAFLVGAALVGGGTALYLFGGDKGGAGARVQAVPAVGKGEIAFAVRGAF